MNISKKNKGFTLLELLVVVAIIGILTAVVLASLNSARNKGADAAVKSNLVNALKQAEIFYGTNTAAIDTYTNVCNSAGSYGALTITTQVDAAAKAYGLTGSPAYTRNNASASATTASCNDSANAWAAEVPLKDGTNQMWCVDSSGKSKQTTGTSLSAADDYTCQ